MFCKLARLAKSCLSTQVALQRLLSLLYDDLSRAMWRVGGAVVAVREGLKRTVYGRLLAGIGHRKLHCQYTLYPTDTFINVYIYSVFHNLSTVDFII